MFASTRGAGHLGPILPLADACKRAGHHVLIAGPASLSACVARSGHEFWAVDDPPARLRGCGLVGGGGVAAARAERLRDRRGLRAAERARDASGPPRGLPLVAPGRHRARVLGVRQRAGRRARGHPARADRHRARGDRGARDRDRRTGPGRDWRFVWPVRPLGERLRAAPYFTWFPESLEEPSMPLPAVDGSPARPVLGRLADPTPVQLVARPRRPARLRDLRQPRGSVPPDAGAVRRRDAGAGVFADPRADDRRPRRRSGDAARGSGERPHRGAGSRRATSSPTPPPSSATPAPARPSEPSPPAGRWCRCPSSPTNPTTPAASPPPEPAARSSPTPRRSARPSPKSCRRRGFHDRRGVVRQGAPHPRPPFRRDRSPRGAHRTGLCASAA